MRKWNTEVFFSNNNRYSVLCGLCARCYVYALDIIILFDPQNCSGVKMENAELQEALSHVHSNTPCTSCPQVYLVPKPILRLLCHSFFAGLDWLISLLSTWHRDWGWTRAQPGSTQWTRRVVIIRCSLGCKNVSIRKEANSYEAVGTDPKHLGNGSRQTVPNLWCRLQKWKRTEPLAASHRCPGPLPSRPASTISYSIDDSAQRPPTSACIISAHPLPRQLHHQPRPSSVPILEGVRKERGH